MRTSLVVSDFYCLSLFLSLAVVFFMFLYHIDYIREVPFCKAYK